PGCCFPVIVESHEGRPTKIEGHPTHPYSRGASDIWAQASILDLYDPDRSKTVLRDGKPSSWEEFDEWAGQHFAELRRKKGEGLGFLIEDVASPAVNMLIEYARTVVPQAKWYALNTSHSGSTLVQVGTAKDGTIRNLMPQYQFAKADIVLALDVDFLGTHTE